MINGMNLVFSGGIKLSSSIIYSIPQVSKVFTRETSHILAHIERPRGRFPVFCRILEENNSIWPCLSLGNKRGNAGS